MAISKFQPLQRQWERTPLLQRPATEQPATYAGRLINEAIDPLRSMLLAVIRVTPKAAPTPVTEEPTAEEQALLR